MALRRKTNRLREIRLSQALSGYDLQILCHIPAQEIYRIERGLKRAKRYEKALLADALKAEESTIFPKDMELSAEIEWSSPGTTDENHHQK